MPDQNHLEQLHKELETKGFVVIEDYLSEATILNFSSILNSEINRTECEYPYNNFDHCHIHDLFVRYPTLLDIIDDPFLDQLLAHFLGEYWVMYAATSSSIPPGKQNFASRIHVDSPRLVPGYAFNMGVIWALSDYTLENGCLEVLPFSHLNQNEPALDRFESEKAQILCTKGSLIVFNARLYHRTTPNLSTNWRHAMTMNACRSFMKQRMDWVRFIGTDAVADYNDRVRRILGFDTRVPSNMDEFSQPEHLRFYKSNQG